MTQQDNSNTALINSEIFYFKITKDTPRGKRCLLINKQAGVATIGELNKSTEHFFDHWYPMPIFKD